jgi:hypothetical protein
MFLISKVCDQCPNVKFVREGEFLTVDIEKGMKDGQVWAVLYALGPPVLTVVGLYHIDILLYVLFVLYCNFDIPYKLIHVSKWCMPILCTTWLQYYSECLKLYNSNLAILSIIQTNWLVSCFASANHCCLWLVRVELLLVIAALSLTSKHNKLIRQVLMYV